MCDVSFVCVDMLEVYSVALGCPESHIARIRNATLHVITQLTPGLLEKLAELIFCFGVKEYESHTELKNVK